MEKPEIIENSDQSSENKARRRQVKAVNSQLMVQQTIRKPQTAMIGKETDQFAMQDEIPQHRREDPKWAVTKEK